MDHFQKKTLHSYFFFFCYALFSLHSFIVFYGQWWSGLLRRCRVLWWPSLFLWQSSRSASECSPPGPRTPCPRCPTSRPWSSPPWTCLVIDKDLAQMSETSSGEHHLELGLVRAEELLDARFDEIVRVLTHKRHIHLARFLAASIQHGDEQLAIVARRVARYVVFQLLLVHFKLN